MDYTHLSSTDLDFRSTPFFHKQMHIHICTLNICTTKKLATGLRANVNKGKNLIGAHRRVVDWAAYTKTTHCPLTIYEAISNVAYPHTATIVRRLDSTRLACTHNNISSNSNNMEYVCAFSFVLWCGETSRRADRSKRGETEATFHTKQVLRLQFNSVRNVVMGSSYQLQRKISSFFYFDGAITEASDIIKLNRYVWEKKSCIIIIYFIFFLAAVHSMFVRSGDTRYSYFMATETIYGVKNGKSASYRKSLSMHSSHQLIIGAGEVWQLDSGDCDDLYVQFIRHTEFVCVN